MARKRSSPLWPAALMLSTASATAYVAHEWWLVPLGAVASWLFYAVMPKATDELPPNLDHAHKQRAMGMLTLRDRLLGDLDEAPEVIRENLAVSGIRVREVSDKFLKLVARHQEVETYLKTSDVNVVVNDLNRLKRLLEVEQDEVARERYQQAVAAREAQLASREEMRRGLARLDGELSNITATLENVLAQIVRMRSAAARGAAEGETGEVTKTLHDLTQEIDVVTESIESVFNAPSRERVR